MDRNEYLKLPLIEGVKYLINGNIVSIMDDCTCFIRIEKQEGKVTLPEVARMLRELKKAAKDTRKIKLKGVLKFLPAVCALYPAYCAANDKMSENFTEIAEIAGTPYQSLGEDLIRIATHYTYDLPILIPEHEPWQLPAGAFGENCGVW